MATHWQATVYLELFQCIDLHMNLYINQYWTILEDRTARFTKSVFEKF